MRMLALFLGAVLPLSGLAAAQEPEKPKKVAVWRLTYTGGGG